MQIEAKHSPCLNINAPEFFKDEKFVQWLNDHNRSLMTWHKKGQRPGEGSDIVTFVDPSLSGDGSDDGEMPDKYWDLIVNLCRKHFKPSDGFHIVVRITNLSE